MKKINFIKLASLIFGLLLVACTPKEENSRQINQEDIEKILSRLDALTVEMVRLQEKVDKFVPDGGVQDSEGGAKSLELALSKIKTVIGSDDAEYAIVEFMDYQCPYCIRHYQTTFSVINSKYIESGLIRYFVKDFPLDFHAKAEGAAVASRCSADQDVFEGMHKALMDNTARLGRDLYLELASSLSLDVDEFETCLDDPESLKKLKNDVSEAIALGVTGTPKFLVGRISGDSLEEITVISGAQSFTAFERALGKLMGSLE